MNFYSSAVTRSSFLYSLYIYVMLWFNMSDMVTKLHFNFCEFFFKLSFKTILKNILGNILKRNRGNSL